MLFYIDNFLNRITMYRLMRYCLAFLWTLGLIFSFFHLLPFDYKDLIFSFAVLFAVCLAADKILSTIFHAPVNIDSTYITAFILSLVAGPARSVNEYGLLALVSLLAIASKYLLVVNKKHVFNPAAFGIAVAAYLAGFYASWWVGDPLMLPFVVACGLLIIRKLQRTDLVLSFFIVFLLVSLDIQALNWQSSWLAIKNTFAYSSIPFFAFIMLTEPATTPPTRIRRIIYGSLTGLLLAPFIHIGSFYFSPELALLAGNLLSFAISPRYKLLLVLKEKRLIAQNTYEFIFTPERMIPFKPGQYLEWTLPHGKQDSRGSRRYFTIASSPTEPTASLGIKFYEGSSSFKQALTALEPGGRVIGSQLSGEFILPENRDKKLIFIAGGIGITPFRSMIKYLIDTNEKRDVVLFYANKTYQDVAYRAIFEQAHKALGITTVYTLSDTNGVPAAFQYEPGMVTPELIKKYAPDFKERTYYISGPRAMILSFKENLQKMGIPRSHIKTDFFPGYT